MYRRKIERLMQGLASAGFSAQGAAVLDIAAGTGVYVEEWQNLGVGRRRGDPARRPSRFRGKFTEIAAASSPLSESGIAQDLRPLLASNVTLLVFAVAILSRLLNWAQERRGGAGFPRLPPSSAKTTPLINTGPRGGDAVRVSSVQQIAETLDSRSRNRGPVQTRRSSWILTTWVGLLNYALRSARRWRNQRD